MRKRTSLLLIFAVFVSTVAAQQKVREKAPGGTDTGDVAQRKADEAQRKAQAVDILKGVVESAVDMQDMRTRIAVLTDALDLLWKHDEAYARANFIKSAAALSDRFAFDTTKRQEFPRSERRWAC